MTVLCDVMGFDAPDVDTLIGYAFDGTELLAGTNTLADMGRLSDRAAEAGALLADWLEHAAPDPDAGVLGVGGPGRGRRRAHPRGGCEHARDPARRGW